MSRESRESRGSSERAEANRRLIEGAYAAFARGDIPAVLKVLDPRILWHVPGRGPLSGNYLGHQQVVAFFQHFQELSGGTFRIRIDDVLANEHRVLVLVTESARRRNREWSSAQVHAWTIEDGKASVFWQFQGDQQTEDEFWS
jgi:ketosteroid isomerase-like protein